MVSHDRYFLNRVCTHILAFEGEGRVTVNPGNYDYYLEKKTSRESDESPRKPLGSTIPANQPAAAKPKRLKWKEERELETMEQTVLAAEDEIARLEAQLASPEFYEKQRAQWPKVEAELKAARDKVAALYARWEELEKMRATAV